MNKKLITVSVPVFNECENIKTAYERISAVCRSLERYDYEIVFYDDGSDDGSTDIIEELCAADDHVKAVIYERNFGYAKTTFYCMQQAKGDAAVIVHCDMQNPPEEIPKFVEKWESGADVVLGVKNKSNENKFMYFLRTLGYYLLNLIFGMKLVPHATEFELIDKSVISVLRNIRTQAPFLRGYIIEYGTRIEKVYYVQDKRRKGRSHFNLNKQYDFFMAGIVCRSRCVPRRCVFFSVVSAILLLVEFFARFLPKAIPGTEPLWNGLLLRFGLFSLLLLIMLTSLALEFVFSVLDNAGSKPFIIEEKRINY